MSPDDLNQIRAEVMPKLVRAIMLSSIANVLLALCVIAAVYFGITKPAQVLAVTETGRVVPLVPLDKPYVGDSRVVGFADECTRTAFSHDFLNFRQTLASASSCFTSEGSASFAKAIEPLIQDLESRRMVMTPTMQPAVVVRTFKKSGQVYSWVVQTKMTLNREGTRERVVPTTYVVDLIIERVPLEESVRGIGVAQINVRPGSV